MNAKVLNTIKRINDVVGVQACAQQSPHVDLTVATLEANASEFLVRTEGGMA
jgi:hypothetical protein